MKTGIIVQARLGSTRFPGKVLEKIGNFTLLEHLMARINNLSGVDEVIIAISDNPKDNPLEEFCREKKYTIFRGDEADVLNRYFMAAQHFNLDTIIRICSDAPMTDTVGLEKALELFNLQNTHFVHNRFKEGWPPGGAIDVFSLQALSEANQKATKQPEREHVIPYLVKNGTKFGEIKMPSPPELSRPYYNLTIDYPEDIQKFEALLKHFEKTLLAEIGFIQAIEAIDRNSELKNLFTRHPHY